MDFTRIRDASDGDTEFEQELFTAYVGDCAERIGRLHAALAAQDAAAFRREAHTIKGSSANVGTTRLQEFARAIEEAEVADGSVPELIARLEAEFGRVKSEIEAYLAEL